MRSRIAGALPLLVAAALYAWVSDSIVVAGLVLLAVMVAIPLAPRLDAPPFVQWAVVLMTGVFFASGGAAALTALNAESATRPSEIASRVAVTALMLSAARCFFPTPAGGVRVDFAILTVAVVACGQRRLGPPYAALVALFVVAIITRIRAQDSGSGWRVVEARSKRALVLTAAITLGLGGVAMFAIPRIARLTQRRFGEYVIPKGSGDVGFSDRMRLRAGGPLEESNELLMRVYGPHVDYLRGRVYDRYDRGIWDNARHGTLTHVETGTGKPPGAAVVEIRGVGTMLKPDTRAFFFLPLGARRIATPDGKAVVDDLGALRPGEDEPPTPIAFELGEAEFPPAPPSAADLEVPPDLRPVLEPLAREWTRGAAGAPETLRALEHRFETDFAYSLEGVPASPTHEPPLVTFLLHAREGRCELFASGMVLLARTRGIPARVVGGFRVAEHNAIGGYDVVRERNAHAWVEAWDGAAWRTFDPTPVSEANLRRDQPTRAAVGDAILALWDRALDQLARLALWQFGVVLAGAVALLTAVRLLRARRERKRESRLVLAGDAPLPCFSELEAALALCGYPRAPSEPLERFADRLRGASHERAAGLVLDYTALRYGGIGDAAVVAARMTECAREITRAPAPARHA